MKKRTRRLIHVLQVALAVVALGWLLAKMDVSEVRTLLRMVSGETLIGIVAISMAALAPRFWLWLVLIDRGPERRFVKAGYVDLTVNLVNQFLPSRITGTSVAPVVVRRCFSIGWDRATAIAGAYTALYALGYGLVALGGFVALVGRVEWPILAVVALATAGYLAMGTTLLGIGVRMERAEWLSASLGVIAGALPLLALEKDAVESTVTRFAADTGDAFREVVSNRRRVLLFWAVLGLFLLVPGIRVALLLADIDALIEPTVLIPLYIVAAYSVTVLPLTPGGIGISEVSATLVLMALGVPEAVAIPVVVTDRVLGVYGPALLGIYPAMRLNLAASAE